MLLVDLVNDPLSRCERDSAPVPPASSQHDAPQEPAAPAVNEEEAFGTGLFAPAAAATAEDTAILDELQ